MNSIGFIVQILLIVGWYVVPAMAALPVWLVFLPLILAAIAWSFMLAIIIIAAVKA